MSIKWGNVLANILTGGLPTIVSSLGKTFMNMNSVSKKSADFTNSDTGQTLKSNVSSLTGDSSNTFLGGLTGMFNKVVTGWDDWTGNTANRENIAFQKEYNEQVFNRADTQYQRTVADLRAAGLSSQLAAGAPSTVAGTAAAPERTVGNESEAISKLVGLVTSMKQTDASVALASAQADKSNAEAEKIRAEIPWINVNNGRDYALAIANKDYTIAMTRLKQEEGIYYSSKVQADISNALSEVNKNNKLIDLYDEQIKLTSAQEGKTQAERKEINQRIENLKQQEKNLKQEFNNIILSGKKLDAETAKLLQDAANAAWNLEKSKEWNLRTIDSQSSIGGLGFKLDNLQTSCANFEDLYDKYFKDDKSAPSEPSLGFGYAW